MGSGAKLSRFGGRGCSSTTGTPSMVSRLLTLPSESSSTMVLMAAAVLPSIELERLREAVRSIKTMSSEDMVALF
jgi:hypothetical protein